MKEKLEDGLASATVSLLRWEIKTRFALGEEETARWREAWRLDGSHYATAALIAAFVLMPLLRSIFV